MYIDNVRIPFKGMLMSHMTADTLDEIHDMAQRLGAKQKYFQCPPKTRFPHYDIPEKGRELALSLGALPVCSRISLYYGAKLGLEWASEDENIVLGRTLVSRYQRTLARTERYVRN